MLVSCLLTVLLPAAGPSPADEVEWFKSGWYAGFNLGVMNANASASDLEADLDAQGHMVNGISLDDTDTGWKVYGGYRFEAPWAIELGYADLGTVESTIDATPPDLNAFLRDLARLHPSAGQGFTAAGQYYFVDTARVAMGLRGGLWLWESDVDASAAGVAGADVDETGLDPFIGATLLIDLTETLQLRAEYEKYFVDGEDVDFLSLGVQVLLF